MFKVLDEVCEPRRGTKYSAYMDLFAREDCVIGAGETKVVKLGVKLDLEKLYHSWYFYTEQNTIDKSWTTFLESNYLEVALRSSLAVQGLIIPNGIGVVDLGYDQECGLIIHNPVRRNFIMRLINENFRKLGLSGILCMYNSGDALIAKGDKIAQCTLKEHKGYLMGYESDVVREGGFGNTGK